MGRLNRCSSSGALCLWITIMIQFVLFLTLCSIMLYGDQAAVKSISSYIDISGIRKWMGQDLQKSLGGRGTKAKYSIIETAGKRHNGSTKELHAKPYNYLIDPASYICNEKIYLLVIIETHSLHAMERDYFRTRWKVNEYHGKKIKVVFSTAWSSMDGVQSLLEKEQQMYGDILQHDFLDHYRNLTLKSLLSLKWAYEECKSFAYVLKTDDDMIINFDVLITQFEKLPQAMTKNLYTGLLMKNKPPIRDITDKWHVTLKEWPHDRYPEYMGGPGYVLSNSAVGKIVAVSPKVNFMPMEDVFIGICAKQAGITPMSNLRFSNFVMWEYYEYCWCKEMITLHSAYFAVRELYYMDRSININRFDFKAWDNIEKAPKPYYNKDEDDIGGGDGSPSVYNCAKTVWSQHRFKELYKHVIKQHIPRSQIIDV